MRLSELGLEVLRDGEFDDLNLIGGSGLGWLSDLRYAERVRGPVIAAPQAAGYVPSEYGLAVADDPETAFWELHERLIHSGFYPERADERGKGTRVHPTAAIGQAGFEVHKARRILHAGWVRIGDRVTIGAHSCVDRSLWKQPTSIGDDTHIDNLVHVAHNVVIGARCMVVAGTVIGGSAQIGDDVFIGINASIAPGVRIGDRAYIGMGVVVAREVEEGERLTVGNSPYLRHRVGSRGGDPALVGAR